MKYYKDKYNYFIAVDLETNTVYQATNYCGNTHAIVVRNNKYSVRRVLIQSNGDGLTEITEAEFTEQFSAAVAELHTNTPFA